MIHTIEDNPSAKALMAEFREMACEIPGCGKRPTCGHHILHRGMGGGNELTVRLNLIAVCAVCHAKIHNASNGFNGRVLRQAELFELVAIREKLHDDVDLQQVLWLILRLPKDASLPQMSRSVALLPLHDRKVCWDVLREMGRVV